MAFIYVALFNAEYVKFAYFYSEFGNHAYVYHQRTDELPLRPVLFTSSERIYSLFVEPSTMSKTLYSCIGRFENGKSNSMRICRHLRWGTCGREKK